MKRSESDEYDTIQYDQVEVACDDDGKTHPDGGWGWFVVAAAFVTQFIITGLQNSSGVIFNELVEKYNRSKGETGRLSKLEHDKI